MVQASKDDIGRSISVLFVEWLKDNTLIGLFSGNRTLKFDLCPRFHQSAIELFLNLSEWQKRIHPGLTNEEIEELRKIVTRIQALSRQCWDALPEFAKEALRPSDDFVLLSCDDVYARFPFEILAYSNETDIPPPDYHFLGLRRVLPRIPALFDSLKRLRDREIGNGSKTAMVFADPHSNLKVSSIEGKHIENLFVRVCNCDLLPDWKAFFGHNATRDNFVEGLRSKTPPSIVHYTGHGSLKSKGEHIALYPPSERGEFYASDLRQYEIRFNSKPLFILNGCRLGWVESFGTVREDLSGELIRRGAEAVIASPFVLSDWHGGIFTYEFYGNEKEGQDIGDRLRQARQAVYSAVRQTQSGEPDIAWPIWALYSLHGNPFARIEYQQDAKLCKKAKRQMEKMRQEMMNLP
jgi:hypothetical protein